MEILLTDTVTFPWRMAARTCDTRKRRRVLWIGGPGVRWWAVFTILLMCRTTVSGQTTSVSTSGLTSEGPSNTTATLTGTGQSIVSNATITTTATGVTTAFATTTAPGDIAAVNVNSITTTVDNNVTSVPTTGSDSHRATATASVQSAPMSLTQLIQPTPTVADSLTSLDSSIMITSPFSMETLTLRTSIESSNQSDMFETLSTSVSLPPTEWLTETIPLPSSQPNTLEPTSMVFGSKSFTIATTASYMLVPSPTSLIVDFEGSGMSVSETSQDTMYVTSTSVQAEMTPTLSSFLEHSIQSVPSQTQLTTAPSLSPSPSFVIDPTITIMPTPSFVSPGMSSNIFVPTQSYKMETVSMATPAMSSVFSSVGLDFEGSGDDGVSSITLPTVVMTTPMTSFSLDFPGSGDSTVSLMPSVTMATIAMTTSTTSQSLDFEGSGDSSTTVFPTASFSLSTPPATAMPNTTKPAVTQAAETTSHAATEIITTDYNTVMGTTEGVNTVTVTTESDLTTEGTTEMATVLEQTTITETADNTTGTPNVTSTTFPTSTETTDVTALTTVTEVLTTIIGDENDTTTVINTTDSTFTAEPTLTMATSTETTDVTALTTVTEVLTTIISDENDTTTMISTTDGTTEPTPMMATSTETTDITGLTTVTEILTTIISDENETTTVVSTTEGENITAEPTSTMATSTETTDVTALTTVTEVLTTIISDENDTTTEPTSTLATSIETETETVNATTMPPSQTTGFTIILDTESITTVKPTVEMTTTGEMMTTTVQPAVTVPANMVLNVVLNVAVTITEVTDVILSALLNLLKEWFLLGLSKQQSNAMPGRRRLLQLNSTTPAVATTTPAPESGFEVRIIKTTVTAGGQLEILFVVVNLNSSDPVVDPGTATGAFSRVTSEEFNNITDRVASNLNITGMPTVGQNLVTTTPAANVTTSPNVTAETSTEATNVSTVVVTTATSGNVTTTAPFNGTGGLMNATAASLTTVIVNITTVFGNTTVPESNATTTERPTMAATLAGNVTVSDNMTASTPGLLTPTPVANVTGTTSSLDNVTSAGTINITDTATTVSNVTDVTMTATAAVTAPTVVATTTVAANVTSTPAAENTTAVNVTMPENTTTAFFPTTARKFTGSVNVTDQTPTMDNVTSFATTVVTVIVTENATTGVNVTGVTMPVNATAVTSTAPTTTEGDNTTVVDNTTAIVNVTDMTTTLDNVTIIVTENATIVMNVTMTENVTSVATTPLATTARANTTAVINVTDMATTVDNVTAIATTVVTMLVTENATFPVNVTDVTTVTSPVTSTLDNATSTVENATSTAAAVVTLPVTDNATSVMNITDVATMPYNTTAAPSVTGNTTTAENVTTVSTPQSIATTENITAIPDFNTTMPVNVTVPTVTADNVTSTTGIPATATTENVTTVSTPQSTAMTENITAIPDFNTTMPVNVTVPTVTAENVTSTTSVSATENVTAPAAANSTAVTAVTPPTSATDNTTATTSTTALTGVPPTTTTADNVTTANGTAAENTTAPVPHVTTALTNATAVTAPAVTPVVENTTAVTVNITTITGPSVTAATDIVSTVTGVTPAVTVSGNGTAEVNTTAAATTPMSSVSVTGASPAVTAAENDTTTMAVTANTTAGTGTAPTATTAVTPATSAATTGSTNISTTAEATSLAATPVSTVATEAANATSNRTTPATTTAVTNTPVPSTSALTTNTSTTAITTKPENTSVSDLATTEAGTTTEPFVTVVNPSTIVENQVTVIVLSLSNNLQQIINEVGSIIQALTNLLQEWYQMALSKQQTNQAGRRRRLLQSPSTAPGGNFVIQVTNVTVLPDGQLQVQFVVVDRNSNNSVVPPTDVTTAFNQVTQQEIRAIASSVGFPLDITGYTVQPLVTEEAPAPSLLWVMGVVLGSLVFIIIILLVVYNFVTNKADAVQPKKPEELGNKLSERYVQKGGLGSVGLLIPAQLPGVPQTSRGQTSYQLRDETEEDKEWITESGLKVDMSKGSITLIPPARPPNKDDVREFGTEHKQGKEAWSDKEAPAAERGLTVDEKPKRSKKEKRKKWRGPAKKHRKEHERPRRTEIPVRPPVRLVGSYESVKSAASMDQIEHEAALFEHVALMNKLEDGEHKKKDTPSVRFKATVHPLQPVSSLPPLKETPLVTNYTTENEVDATKEAVLEEEDEVLREQKMKAVKEEDWDTLDTIIKLRAEVEHLRNKERQREKQKKQQQAAKTPGQGDGPFTPMPPPKPLTQQEKQRMRVKEVWEDAQKQLEGLLEPQYFPQAAMTPVARKMQAARRNRWRTSRLGAGHPADVLPGEVQFDKKMGRNMRAAQPKVGDYMRTDSNIKLVRVAPISDEANTAGRDIPITAQPRSVAEQARREAAILGQGGDPYVQLLRMASIPSPMAPQPPSQSPSQQLRDDEEVQRLLEEAFPLEDAGHADESRVEESVTSRSVTETERGTVKSGKTGDRKSQVSAKRKLRPKTAAVAPDDSLQSTSRGLSPRPPRQAFSEPRVPQLLTPPTGISLSGDRTPYHDPYYTPAMVDTAYSGHPSVRTSTPRAPRFSTMAQPTMPVDPYGHGLHHPAMGRAYRRVSPGTELPHIQPGRAASHLVWQPETPAMMSRYGDFGPGVAMQNPIYDIPRPSVGGLDGSLYEPERTNLSFLDQLRSTPVRAYTQPSPYAYGGVQQQPMAQPSQQPTTGQQQSQDPITEHSLPGVMSSLTNEQRDTLLQLIREEYGKLEQERGTKDS
ncbi:mucin-22-like isoform X2 [Branchiostoma lanceolatum]|uniref:mucin-22-like isoform X2 n=1 Tax=Branchiostoma lanceolatum TaxID=7740 RepID=UPI003451AB55